MIICPNCRKEISETLECVACGWKGAKVGGGIWNCMRAALSDLETKYVEDYDINARRALTKPSQTDSFLETQAQNIVRLAALKATDAVCEIGVGNGHFIRHALKVTSDVTGVDIAVPYLSVLPDGVRCVLADAEHLPFENAFDVVVSSDVIEHVLNVGSFLECIHKALKAGGRFVVRTPLEENIMGWSVHTEGAPTELGHLRNFNKSLLKMILEDAGFKVEKIHYDGARFGNIYRWIRRYRVLGTLHAGGRSLIRKTRVNKGTHATDRADDGVFLQKIYNTCACPKEIVMVATKQ